MLAGNITGRTSFDKDRTSRINPEARYFHMNETMRPCFYTGKWDEKEAESHSIFLSQGDYPLKGFHFMLNAMPEILEKYPDAHVYVAGNNIMGRSKYPYFLRASAYSKYIKSLISKNRLKKNRLLCPWDSPGKNAGVGCHSLLQGIFLTQGSNPGSPALFCYANDFLVSCFLFSSNIGIPTSRELNFSCLGT